jgi:hypothetical protein
MKRSPCASSCPRRAEAAPLTNGTAARLSQIARVLMDNRYSELPMNAAVVGCVQPSVRRRSLCRIALRGGPVDARSSTRLRGGHVVRAFHELDVTPQSACNHPRSGGLALDTYTTRRPGYETNHRSLRRSSGIDSSRPTTRSRRGIYPR